MSVKPVYLEDVPSVMTLKEVPQEILVPNPGGRELVITPEESGYGEEQVFTSNCLPDEISYEFLGLIMFPDGNVYPKYKANAVTETKLWLKGKIGYENGISIIDKVAWWLTWQEKMLEAKSIKKSDLNFFDYEKENLSSYWLSSHGVIRANYINFGPGVVYANGGVARVGVYIVFDSYGLCNAFRAGVRPTMILTSKILIASPEFSWVEF